MRPTWPSLCVCRFVSLCPQVSLDINYHSRPAALWRPFCSFDTGDTYETWQTLLVFTMSDYFQQLFLANSWESRRDSGSPFLYSCLRLYACMHFAACMTMPCSISSWQSKDHFHARCGGREWWGMWNHCWLNTATEGLTNVNLHSPPLFHWCLSTLAWVPMAGGHAQLWRSPSECSVLEYELRLNHSTAGQQLHFMFSSCSASLGIS